MRHGQLGVAFVEIAHPGGNPGANLMSISHRCHPILVAFEWELTKETIDLTLGCLQGGGRDVPVLACILGEVAERSCGRDTRRQALR